MGEAYGLSLVGLVYMIPIKESVGFPYICPPRNAPINPIIPAKKKERTTASIYLRAESLKRRSWRRRTLINPTIPHIREKL